MSTHTRLRTALALLALAIPAAAQDNQPAKPAPAAPAAPAKPAAAPQAAAKQAVASPADAEVIVAQLPTYPMNSCIACGKIWGPEDTPLDLVRQGRLIRVCNEACVKPFDVQSAKWFKVLDDQIIAAQTASYPLTQCPLSHEPLGKKPKYAVVGTRLIEVCCGDCRQEVLGDPAKSAAILKQVDEALVAAQSQDYPLETCVVDGKPLGESKVQRLHGVTLVRFCSADCEAKFAESPREHVAKVAAARKSRPAGSSPGADKAKGEAEGKPGR